MTNSVDPRAAIRESLLQSYKHRIEDGCKCAICGATDTPLAFHVLEKSIKEGELAPTGFVPMSASMGYVRGSFPLCKKCAPPCSSCKLPIDSPVARRFGQSVQAKLGVGHCREHIHWKYVLGALISKIFK